MKKFKKLICAACAFLCCFGVSGNVLAKNLKNNRTVILSSDFRKISLSLIDDTSRKGSCFYWSCDGRWSQDEFCKLTSFLPFNSYKKINITYQKFAELKQLVIPAELLRKKLLKRGEYERHGGKKENGGYWLYASSKKSELDSAICEYLIALLKS